MICNLGGDGEWNGLTISWIVPRSISGNAVTQPSGFCCACEPRSAKRPSRVVKERNSGIRLRRVKAAQGSASDAHGVSDILAAAVGPATSPR
jgi:hypothetical protein